MFLYSSVGANTSHQSQESGYARVTKVVVRIAHFKPHLGRNVSGGDSRHISFASGKVVAKAIRILEDLLMWDHLSILQSLFCLTCEL